MNPPFTLAQALWLALACLLLGFTPGHVEALVLAVLLAAWCLAWNASYAAALAGCRRSDRRRRLDRRVAWQTLGIVAAGVVAGVGGAHVKDLWLWHDRELLSISAGTFAALAGVVYASSMIDWHFTRPRLDGIVCEPPCRSSGDERWAGVTRVWYLHRGVTEILGIGLVIATFSSLIGGLIAGSGTLPTAAIVAISGGAAGALLLLTQTAISTLRNHVATRPSIWIGDELRDGDWRAYVLHVTVRGIVVREWDAETQTWEREREIPHDRLDEGRVRRTRFEGCGACLELNSCCEWLKTEHAAGERRRWLVW